DSKTVTASWIAQGWLEATQLHAGQPGSSWLITDAQLEAFIRTSPHVYDWQRMRPGRWRSLAELVWRRDPLFTVQEAAPLLGISRACARKSWRAGRLRALRRFRNPGPWAGEWLIHRSALHAFRPAPEIAAAEPGFTVIPRAEAEGLIAALNRCQGLAALAARR